MTLIRGLYRNTFNLLLHVVVQLLDGVEAALEPSVLLAPLSDKILQLVHLLLVFLVRYTHRHILWTVWSIILSHCNKMEGKCKWQDVVNTIFSVVRVQCWSLRTLADRQHMIGRKHKGRQRQDKSLMLSVQASVCLTSSTASMRVCIISSSPFSLWKASSCSLSLLSRSCSSFSHCCWLCRSACMNPHKHTCYWDDFVFGEILWANQVHSSEKTHKSSRLHLCICQHFQLTRL